MRRLMTSMAMSLACVLACSCTSNNDDMQSAGIQKRSVPSSVPETRGEFPEKDPPIQADTYYAAGRLAEARHDSAQAIAQYRKTLELKADHVGATYCLANLYTQLGQFDDALPLWQKYVQLTRSSAESFSDLAYCYDLAGKFPEAERNYQLALTRDPKCEVARINYGIMLASLGRTEEAVKQLGTALSAPAVHYYIGLGRERHGDKAGALAEYRTALTIDPQLKEAQARVAELTSTR